MRLHKDINHSRIRELAKSAGIDFKSGLVPVAEPFCQFEHFLHEVGHALSLGIPVIVKGDPLEERIEYHLDRLEERCMRRQRARRRRQHYWESRERERSPYRIKHRNEALVLAAEMRLFERILASRMPWRDHLFDCAHSLGCVQEWNLACSGPRHHYLAHQLFGYLHEHDVLNTTMRRADELPERPRRVHR